MLSVGERKFVDGFSFAKMASVVGQSTAAFATPPQFH